MKKGVILYVTGEKEGTPMQQELSKADCAAAFDALGAEAVCVATSEDEIAYSWWRLVAKGMHQVVCMTAAFDPIMGSCEPKGVPFRLCG
ncbi:MAG: hypothetical protein AB7W37_10010 [Syntrophobacteraceae bacterium]|mgnify:CR=1 FL=1